MYFAMDEIVNLLKLPQELLAELHLVELRIWYAPSLVEMLWIFAYLAPKPILELKQRLAGS